MQKPNSYDETQTGEYIPVELGGHYAIIKKVTETTSSKGKPMIVISIDFDKKDNQPGYFMEQFRNDIRPDKKYPNQAVCRITTETDEGKCSKRFKSFCKAFEDSNKVETKWGNDFENQFKNKKIGVVFGEEENEYNGKISMRRVIRWFCDYEKVHDQKIPDPVYIDGKASKQQAKADDEFENIPEGVNEEIPFE